MAKTNWTMYDTVLPADMNQIGKEINANTEHIGDMDDLKPYDRLSLVEAVNELFESIIDNKIDKASESDVWGGTDDEKYMTAKKVLDAMSMFGTGTAVKNEEDLDLDNLRIGGSYVAGSSSTGMPFGVTSAYIVVVPQSYTRTLQILYSQDSPPRMYYRSGDESGWSEWVAANVAGAVSFIPPTGMTATDVQEAIEEVRTEAFQYGSEWKTEIADAITAKDVPTSATDNLETFKNNIMSIADGTGGDATPSMVLSGATFTNDNGPQVGTMPNYANQEVIGTWVNPNKSTTVRVSPINDGLYTGGDYKSALLVGDANLVPGNIKNGVKLFNVDGTYGGGSLSIQRTTINNHSMDISQLDDKTVRLITYIEVPGLTLSNFLSLQISPTTGNGMVSTFGFTPAMIFQPFVIAFKNQLGNIERPYRTAVFNASGMTSFLSSGMTSLNIANDAFNVSMEIKSSSNIMIQNSSTTSLCHIDLLRYSIL